MDSVIIKLKWNRIENPLGLCGSSLRVFPPYLLSPALSGHSGDPHRRRCYHGFQSWQRLFCSTKDDSEAWVPKLKMHSNVVKAQWWQGRLGGCAPGIHKGLIPGGWVGLDPAGEIEVKQSIMQGSGGKKDKRKRQKLIKGTWAGGMTECKRSQLPCNVDCS